MEIWKMRKIVAQKTSNKIPNYYVYGEENKHDDPDLVHVEKIRTSGKLHKWHMEPHQHRHYFQIIYLLSGATAVQIDGVKDYVKGPTVITIPPGCVHGFQFQPNTDGYALTIAETLLFEKINSQNHDLPKQLLERAHIVELGDNHDQLDEIEFILKIFHREYGSPELGRALMLQLLLHALMLLIRRLVAEIGDEMIFDSVNAHNYNRFRALVEEHFKQHWQVKEYASRLGMAERHLNRICHTIKQQSALEVIHRRLLLEAKRQLIYTTAPVASIAFKLGFQDPAYFSRFFKKNNQITPGLYRNKHNRTDLSPFRTA
tara:strand:- start:297 stop:1244 length:948 start_codon:yes stop_codon:yes gene_type:complete